MSCSYAQGLSKYENKGKLGLPERFDPADEVERKAQILAQWMKESKHTVIHTGAGISTAAGIPDFRGPNGVWTLEKEGLKPEVNISWDDARPTLTHMAIVSLEQQGYVQYVVTQNIDGLHLRSGLPRRKLAELHGDMFVDKCNLCQRQFVRSSAATTVGQKSEGKSCPARRSNGRRCRGKLHDNILDWEDGLPDADLGLAISNACVADLSLCLGTTLQIVPSGNIPVDTKKRGGKLVICNLQPTKQDRHADLIINTYVNDLMKRLLELMAVPLVAYSPKDDPLKITQQLLQNSRIIGRSEEDAFEPIEWTIPEEWVKDNDLAERVKARKVIRKRPGGVKEEAVERKKVKNSQVSEVEERMEEGKGEGEERDGVNCKNGEMAVKKEEGGIKEEAVSIKEEEKGVKMAKQELVERAETACDEIKREEEVVKSKIEKEKKVKVEKQGIDSSENDKMKDKTTKEKEEEENGKAYSNGNTEDEKEENEEMGPKTHNQEEREEEEEKTGEDKTFTNGNTNDGEAETDENTTKTENTKVNEQEEEDEKTKTSESYTNGNQNNDNDDEIKIAENGRTEKYRSSNLDTGKGVSGGQASGVAEEGSTSPGQGNDLDT